MASVIIALEQKSAFIQSPPAGWRLNASTNKMTCEDDSVYVLTTDKKFQGRSPCLEVDSIEQLNEIRQVVRSKPILSTVICQKSHHTGNPRDESSESEIYTHHEKYVVIINTSHPQIIEQFDDAFERAENCFKEEKKFRITINLSESIKIWFHHNVYVDQEIKNSAEALGGDIYLSYGVGAPAYADQWFSCEANTQKCCWCVCFPFFFLCFLPYWIYKKIIMGVEEHKISKPVPVTYHKGPFQIGFNLMNLFYPPGTIFTTITTIQQPYPNQQPYTQQPITNQPIPYGYTQQAQGYQHPSPQGYRYPYQVNQEQTQSPPGAYQQHTGGDMPQAGIAEHSQVELQKI